ncbi:uncharacterized protein RJT21DRAFT_117578 [Scheffersomyces amazonensis]|uniref:uncharacterized protein n=1 Tax=Scheffersomyces amazonensis TaxID=1078765 RepID=UPI00315D04ED
MYKVTSVTLTDINDKEIVKDVQLWNKQSNNEESNATQNAIPNINNSYRRLPIYLNYRLIPIYLIAGNPLHVFSTSETTKEWFKHNLLQKSFNVNEYVSLIFESTSSTSPTYLIFYYKIKTNQIYSIVIDFSYIQSLLGTVDKLGDIESSLTKPRSDSNTVVFDKVLQQKKKRSSPFLVDQEPSSSIALQLKPKQASSPSLSILTTQDQVNSAINKIILSGLRIRGFSTNLNDNINNKLTIKEIYQMTYKATLFSLRKYNFNFINNKLVSDKDIQNSNIKQHPIRINDLQDIVEKLLQLFIDIDDPNVV